MKRILVALSVLLAAASSFAVVPGTDVYLPALAHLTTFTGVVWRGDVWIYNPSTTQSATVSIYLLLRQPNPSPEVRTVTVNPGETRYFNDIMGAGLFNKDTASGAIRVVSSTPVVVTGESYVANTITSLGTGTSGQFFSGTPADQGIGAGQSTDVTGMDQDALGATGKFRSNVGVVETAGGTVNFVLDRVDSNGTAVGSWACDGTNPSCVPLGAREVRQFDRILEKYSPQTGTNQRIRIRVTGGTGKLIAAGSRIDNTTGDPSTMEMWTTAGAAHSTGLFHGAIWTPDGTPGPSVVDGGLEVGIATAGLSGFSGSTGIPCGAVSYVVDLSASPATPVPLNADGSFSLAVTPPPYQDGGVSVFTTTWTLSGTLANGVVTGTLRSDTTGGTGTWAGCNQSGIVRAWRAAWTKNP